MVSTSQKRWTLLYQQGDMSRVLCATFLASFTRDSEGVVTPKSLDITLFPRGHAQEALRLSTEDPLASVTVPEQFVFAQAGTKLSGLFRGLIIEGHYTIWAELHYGVPDRPPLHFEGNVVSFEDHRIQPSHNDPIDTGSPVSTPPQPEVGESLFSFVHTGFPDQGAWIDRSLAFVCYDPTNAPPFYNDLSQARNKGREAMRVVSETYLQSHDFVGTPSAMGELSKSIIPKDTTPQDKEMWLALIKEQLGHDYDPPEVSLVERIWMSVFALLCLPGQAPEWLSFLLDVLVAEHALKALLDQEQLWSQEELHVLMHATVVLPSTLFPLPWGGEKEAPSKTTSGLHANIQGSRGQGGWLTPYALGEMRVVRRQPRQYIAGDLVNIDTLLPGERRERRLEERQRREAFQEDAHAEHTSQDETQSMWHNTLSRALVTAQDTVTHDYGSGDSKFTLEYGQLPTNVTLSGSWTKTDDPGKGQHIHEAARRVLHDATRAFQQATKQRARIHTTHEKTATWTRVVDNSTSQQPLHALYHWLDQLFDVELVHMGNRLILQFLVLDPAKAFIQTQLDRLGVRLQPPETPQKVLSNIKGSPATRIDLDASNYQEVGAAYQLYDLPLPPEPEHIISALLSPNEPQSLRIPPGYVAKKVTWASSATNNVQKIEGLIGTHSFSITPDAAAQSQTMKAVEGALPAMFRVSTKNEEETMPQASLSIRLTSQPSNSTQASWRNKVWRRLEEGYQHQVSEFLKAAQVNTPSWSTSPRGRRAAEHSAMEQGVLTLLASLSASTQGTFVDTDIALFAFEAPDIEHRLRALLRFQEMAFGFLPAKAPDIQGPQHNWRRLFGSWEQDPKTTTFLEAGSARVLVPVGLHHAPALLYYLGQHEIWRGDSTTVPIMESDLDVMCAIKALMKEPSEIVEDRWVMRAPTPHITVETYHSTPYKGGA